MIIKNAVLFFTFFAMLQLFTFSDSAECLFKQEEFEWSDKYNKLIEMANCSDEFQEHDMHLTKNGLVFGDYIKIYALDGKISLNDYKQGDINDFIKTNSEHSWEEFHYTENGYTAFLSYDSGEPYLHNCQPSYEYSSISLKAIEKQAANYCSGGDVIVIRTGITLNFWAIISDNGIPQYVVVLDTFALDPIYCSNDDSENDRIIKNIYSELYKKGQRVFDFDFMQDLATAYEDTLPDNFVYTPTGLQAGLKNSISNIDGIYFYFNQDGICKGKYTGYARNDNDTLVYYENGVLSDK